MYEISSLAGEVAVVTGAGQGIGEAITRVLAASGATVIAVDRESAGIDALAQQLPSVLALQGDVTDAQLPQHLEALLAEHSLTLSILVNNAGVARGSHALETSDEDLQRYFDINIKGVFALSRWALPHLMRQQQGAIVNTASVFGLIGAQSSAGYSLSKAAVVSMTQQMATDFGPSGVRVNAVAPGLIATPLTEERINSEEWRRHIMIEQTALKRVGTPLDVARVVRFLASDEAAFITGQVIAVDGGWVMGRYPRQEAICVD